MERHLQSHEKVGAALSEVVEAGQNFLVDRLDLAAVEGRAYLERAATRSALVALGGLVLLGALITLDVGLVSLLERSLQKWEALFACALLNGLVGGGLIIAGLREPPEPKVQ